MGQRHQAFLIARIRSLQGHYAYRCVGAFHHQWSLGTLPLRALHRYIELLRRKENAAVVRGELNELDGKYEASAMIPAMPCPYTVSLLGVAWTTNFEGELYMSGVTFQQAILDANMGCWDGDNDDGITIVDITDPAQPAYCFVRRSNIPLSAYEYLRHYYDLPNLCKVPDTTGSDDIREGPDSGGGAETVHPVDVSWPLSLFLRLINLAGVPIITTGALQETWPSVPFRQRDAVMDTVPGPCLYHPLVPAVLEFGARYSCQYEGSSVESLDGLAVSQKVAETMESVFVSSESSAADLHRAQSLLSAFLGDSALYDFVIELSAPPLSHANFTVCRELVDEYLKVPCDFDQTRRDSLLSMPGIVDVLRAITPFPAEGLEVLIATLAQMNPDSILDLSGFDLSTDQVIQVVSSFPDIPSLDLSRNPNLVATDIPVILAAAPNILRLIIMGCQSLDGGRLLELVRGRPELFRRVEGILHPSFLSLIKTPVFPIAFTIIMAGQSYVSGVALPFFTPNLVIQTLATVLPLAWRERYPPGSGGFDEIIANFQQYGSLAFSAAMIIYAAVTTGTLPPGEPWSRRPVVSVPLQPLAVVSNHPDGSWAFFLDWHPARGRVRWGFIHYSGVGLEDDTRRTGKVYDLEEFLRCMANEGRPAPESDLVHEVKGILDAKHSADGEQISPLIDECDVPEVTTEIPEVESDEDMENMLWHSRHLYRIPGFDSQF